MNKKNNELKTKYFLFALVTIFALICALIDKIKGKKKKTNQELQDSYFYINDDSDKD